MPTVQATNKSLDGVPSKYSSLTGADPKTYFQASTGDTQSTANSSSFGDSSSFSGIQNEDALKSLMEFITKAATGGSETFKQQQAIRQGEVGDVKNISNDYSKGNAFNDAALLMSQNLRQSMESAMPSITKATVGAGTSAGSMQGLLAQKFATESAQAAGALGAQQATQYGQIRASLANTIEALTRVNNASDDNFLKALDLLKTSVSNSQQGSQSTQQSTGTQRSAGSTDKAFVDSKVSSDGTSKDTSPFSFIPADDTRKNSNDTYVYQPYSWE